MSSIRNENGPGVGPPAKMTAMRSWPSIPPKAENGNAYSFHSAPATKVCVSGEDTPSLLADSDELAAEGAADARRAALARLR